MTKRRILEVLLLGGIVFAAAWVIRALGWDSAFSLICALGAVLSLDFKRPEESLLYVLAATIVKNVRRLIHAVPPPEASITYTSVSSGAPVPMNVRAIRLFAEGKPTHLLWLVHECFDGQEFALIDTIDGHIPELFVLDFDGDGIPELAARWACGAHSRGFRLYRFTGRTFVPVKGTEIGSDWPEITWEDRGRPRS